MNEESNFEIVERKDKSLTKRTLNGFLWMFTSSGLQGILQIIVLIILARLLIPEEFGVVNVALLIIGFSEIFLMLGVGPAIVQMPKITDHHIRIGFTISIVFGVLIAIIIWILSPYIANFYKMDELEQIIKVLVILFPLQGASVIPMSLLQRELKFNLIAKTNIISFSVGYALTGITLALLGFGVWSLVIAHITQAIIDRILLFFYQRHSIIPYINKVILKEFIFFGGGITLGRVNNYIALQGDNAIVGRMLGAESLGLYGRAYQLMAMPAKLFGQVMDKVLFPVMSKVQGDQKRLLNIYKNGITITALVILPISAFIFLLAPEIVDVLLGDSWTAVIEPMRVFALGMLFRTSYKISESVARAKGAVYRIAYREAIYAIAIIIGVLIGVKWDITGVAIGVLIALLIQFIQKSQLSIKLVNMTWKNFLSAHIAPLLITLLISLETMMIVMTLRYYDVNSFFTLAISSLVFFISFFILLTRYPKLALGKDSVGFFHKVINYIPRNKFTNRVVTSIVNKNFDEM